MIKKYLNKLLLIWINSLVKEQNIETFGKYRRINPFYENFVPWSEKSKFFSPDASSVTVYNSTTIVGDVSIGANTWIGPFVTLDGTGGLVIGKNVSISSGSQLLSHDTVFSALSGGNSPYSHSKTHVGDNCFVGTNAIILKGRRVGNYCVIGAGSVVTKDLPDFSIAVGNPATVTGKVLINEKGEVQLKFYS
jgi:acetyltransferase-like isoleucine patch superfamily enzyme